MRAATVVLLILIQCSSADENTKLREALARVHSDTELHDFDNATELPPHLQHMRFYFESRKQGFREARALLEAGTDPNGSPTGNDTFLSWCATGGAADAISLRLRYKADPNRPAPGWTQRLPLVEAAKQSYLPAHLRAMDVLLKGGADATKQDGEGKTPLMAAAENGAFQGVQLLLRRGADPNVRSRSAARGWTALMFAASRGNPRSAEALLRGGADPRLEAEEGKTALSMAVANQHSQTVSVIEKYLKDG